MLCDVLFHKPIKMVHGGLLRYTFFVSCLTIVKAHLLSVDMVHGHTAPFFVSTNWVCMYVCVSLGWFSSSLMKKCGNQLSTDYPAPRECKLRNALKCLDHPNH